MDKSAGQVWFDRRMAGHGLRAARGPIAGLLLLCFLSSLSSLRSDLLPNLTPVALPQMEGKVLAFALLAVAAAGSAGWRRAEWPRGRKLLDSVLVGVVLFVVPAVLVAAAAPWISSEMRVVLFSLAPVFAVVFEPYIGRGPGAGIRGGLLGGIAAVAGVLCVFPVEAPHSFAAGGALCAVMVAVACVAAANCYAVRIAAELKENSIAPMVAIAGVTASVGLAAASAMTEQVLWRFDALAPSLAWSAGVELPGLLLLFWLMRRMSAARMTTRFVLAPLMAIVVSMAFVRPEVDLRGWLGLLLMAGGEGWLLLAPEDDTAAGSSILKLEP